MKRSQFIIFIIFSICLGLSLSKEYASFTEINSVEESQIVKAFKQLENQRLNRDFTTILNEENFKLEQQRLLEETVIQFTASQDTNIRKEKKIFDKEVKDSCQQRDKEGNVSDFYYFLPNLAATAKKVGDTIDFSNNCFKKSTLTFVSLENGTAHLELEVSEPTSTFCDDNYLLSTSHIHHPVMVFRHGTHKITIKNLTLEDLLEISMNGLRLLSFCQNAWKSLYSLYDTVKLYLGGFYKNYHIPKYQEQANLDFIKRYCGKDYKDRGEYGKKMLNIDKNEIKTGDFIAILRMDGLDELIMMGTGSSIGHTAVAVWIDDELYITESQDGWYWPKHGIQRNKFDDWVKSALDVDFNVVVVPLKPEYREKLDTKKAIEWFKSVEGLNYGYHNFIFTWLDTSKNFPVYIDYEVFLALFGIFGQVAPETYNLIVGEALNKRAGTENLNMTDTLAAAASKNMTFEDLMSMPEMQGWKYSDGENYVCSCYCAGFYKAGGLFGDLEIQPQEFTPKDVYQLIFFDKDYNKPQVCKDADPDTPFCQILGKNRIIFEGVGSIEPYDKMNERCISQAPEFVRPDGC
jgi:hypothetical protein